MFVDVSSQLSQDPSLDEKISPLDKYPFLKSFNLTLEEQCLLKQLIAIGQDERLFGEAEISHERLSHLLFTLSKIDRFYREIGGLIGYQAKICSHLEKKENPLTGAKFHPPSFIDISEDSEEVSLFIDRGIESLPLMAEIYPLGGAADRLHLVDADSGVELPAAKLNFCGKTLLERLILDLEARENLYFQKYGKKIVTPIAIMTSLEKNNHEHVVEICESLNYFNRPKDSIRFFTQPLVPAVDEHGNWHIQGPCKALLKPGGHGAIWKLALDEGIFSWLKSLGRTKALVRQINNPIAGLDYGLLAFVGVGFMRDMLFGFASCPRLLKAAEGVNVLVEKDDHVVLTNIEYCDFEKFGIEDAPLIYGAPYSRFSSNTNLLFVDLQAVEEAVIKCPFPGLLVNIKPGSYLTEWGEKKEALIGRLESTMQNIADVFIEKKGEDLNPKRTFVTYNKREKTISTAKKGYISKGALQETPENCFYDLLVENGRLLQSCGFELPRIRTIEEDLRLGPSSLFLYSPLLGPLYREIRKKLRGGSLKTGSEVVLEIENLQCENLHVDGSLQIYGEEGSVCILENVRVKNLGVDWHSSAPFWKMGLKRKESVKIILKKNSRFEARNQEFTGNQVIIVE